MLKTATLTVAVVLTTLSGVAWFFMASEREANTFSSYEEAAQSGLMERGWIPAFIPRSAYDIKEKHRVDSPRIDVDFRFHEGDVGSLERACSIIREGVYACPNAGYPVEVRLENDGYATIRSVRADS